MARHPQGPAAAQHGVRLLLPLAMGWHAGSHSPRALRAMSGTGRTGSQSDRGDHRQPKREKCGKRGAAIDPSGYDAGKKIKGKKRHILVDTQGLLMQAIIHAADVQDRDGGLVLMASPFGLYPFLLKLFADGGYQGMEFKRGLRKVFAWLDVEVGRPAGQAKAF